jgi:hypothetical protein
MIQEAFALWGHAAFLDPILADWLEEQGALLLTEAVRAGQSCKIRHDTVGSVDYVSRNDDGYGDGSGAGNGTDIGRGDGRGGGHG